MKKLLSCLLLAAMFLSLSLTGAWSGRALAEAPADQAGAEDAVGVWIGLVDMLPILEEEDADLAKHLGSVFASVTLELLEDGSYDLEVDSTSMISAFRVGMVGYIEEVCEQFGLTVEEFEQMNGKTVSETIEESIAQMETGDLVIHETGTYVQEGSEITFDGSDSCTFTGDALLIELDEYGTVELTRAGTVGLWSAEVRLGDVEGSEELPAALQDVTFNRILELRSDDSFILSMNLESFYRSYRNAVKVTFLESLEESGVTATDVETVYGKTVDEVVDELIAKTDLSPLEQVLTGSYTEKDGELTGTGDDGTRLEGSWSRNKMTLKIEDYATLQFTHLSTEDVLAKGEGDMARRMSEAAREEKIPIMREAPLARALFEEGKEDEYVPEDLILQIAEVLRFVKSLEDS